MSRWFSGGHPNTAAQREVSGQNSNAKNPAMYYQTWRGDAWWHDEVYFNASDENFKTPRLGCYRNSYRATLCLRQTSLHLSRSVRNFPFLYNSDWELHNTKSGYKLACRKKNDKCRLISQSNEVVWGSDIPRNKPSVAVLEFWRLILGDWTGVKLGATRKEF